MIKVFVPSEMTFCEIKTIIAAACAKVGYPRYAYYAKRRATKN